MRVTTKSGSSREDSDSRIEQRLAKIEAMLAQIMEEIQEMKGAITSSSEKREWRQRKQNETRKGREKKGKGIDRLRREGVAFESDMQNINYTDRLFKYFARFDDVIVLEGMKERVAVTKEYLAELLEELKGARNPTDAEKRLRDEKMRKLYKFLRANGFLIFDGKDWKLNLE